MQNREKYSEPKLIYIRKFQEVLFLSRERYLSESSLYIDDGDVIIT